MFATAAVGNFPFAGSAGADSVFARTVWKTIYGACPAMRSPGNARTVGDRTDSAISEGPTLCGMQNTSGVLQIFGFSQLRNLNIVTELRNQRVRFDVNPEFMAPKPLGLFIFQILTAEFSKRLLYPRSPRACRYRQPATCDNFSPP